VRLPVDTDQRELAPHRVFAFRHNGRTFVAYVSELACRG
jgi:hypothetical protein